MPFDYFEVKSNVERRRNPFSPAPSHFPVQWVSPSHRWAWGTLGPWSRGWAVPSAQGQAQAQPWWSLPLSLFFWGPAETKPHRENPHIHCCHTSCRCSASSFSGVLAPLYWKFLDSKTHGRKLKGVILNFQQGLSCSPIFLSRACLLLSILLNLVKIPSTQWVNDVC